MNFVFKNFQHFGVIFVKLHDPDDQSFKFLKQLSVCVGVFVCVSWSNVTQLSVTHKPDVTTDVKNKMAAVIRMQHVDGR